jgi:DNA-binding HxlR family transcriptional regulator
MRYPEKAVFIKPDATIVELDERHWSVLAACLDGPRKASELLTHVLGLTHQTRNRRLFLSPLVSQGYLHYHEDSSSRAPAKSYTITANGKRLLKSRNNVLHD